MRKNRTGFILKRMSLLLLFSLIMFSLIFCTEKISEENQINGHLVIIGGGKRPDSIMKKFIELADGFANGKIIVLPMASGVPDEVGPAQAEQLQKLGAKNVSFLIVSEDEAQQDSIVSKLNGVTGIFFSGGVQSRLMNIIGNTPFADKIHQLYKDGTVIGGTSAGAAVMSEVMITGDEKRPDSNPDRNFIKIEGDNIITEKGLGLLKTCIVDQHFVRRKRHNRLISLVIENPNLVGIGIDESTAVIVYPDQTFEIIGENSVIFYDARKATVAPFDSTRLELAAANLKMHVLTDGYKINLVTNKIIQPNYE